ncbi:hypothetical protein G7Y79_00073g098330 [Physcia stellaris]|nr:hypothetical protein G7Y79_00073g098330 [Physcia stellaris]
MSSLELDPQRTQAKSLAGLETISEPNSEEEYSESEVAYSENPLERGARDQGADTDAPPIARSPQNTEDHLQSPFSDPHADAPGVLDNFDFDSVLQSNDEFPESDASNLRFHIEKQFYNRITISDDRSVGSKVDQRNLIALRGRGTYVPESGRFDGWVRKAKRAKQSAEDKLRMLEEEKRQNQKGLLVAIQDPDQDPSKIPAAMELEPDIMQVLDQADPSKLDLRKLQKYIELLQRQAREFEPIRNRPAPSRYQIIYRIPIVGLVQQRHGKQKWTERYMPFFDHPEWVRGQGTASQLKSNLPLTNFELYLEQNKEISFLVYRNFDGESLQSADQPGTDNPEGEKVAHRPHHVTETVRLVHKDLIKAIKALLDSQGEYAELARQFSISLELPAPYLFIYHSCWRGVTGNWLLAH